MVMAAQAVMPLMAKKLAGAAAAVAAVAVPAAAVAAAALAVLPLGSHIREARSPQRRM